MTNNFIDIGVGEMGDNTYVFQIPKSSGYNNNDIIQITSYGSISSSPGSSGEDFRNTFALNTNYYIINYVDGHALDSNDIFNLSLTQGGSAITSATLTGASGGFVDSNETTVEYKFVDNTCFLGNTPIDTDQGKIQIKNITTKNTINGYKVQKVINVISRNNKMILIKKGVLDNNVPNNDTYISHEHCILINGLMIEAKHLVNNKTIRIVKMNRQKNLYNILLDHHGKMKVNNMIVETLDPNSKFA